MKLAELGEFGLIDRIAGRVRPGGTVRLGIGDDAAATLPTAGMLTLTTTDMLVEGIHFDLAYSDPVTLGRKSLAVNLSDIAAMGGIPRYCFLSLAIPPSCPVEFLDRFVTAFLDLADRHGVTLAGGDTCASRDGLIISVTQVGEQAPGRIVSRAGARPGDLVCVTGFLGDAALGLELLRQGERDGEAVRRQLAPEARVSEGVALARAGLPSAMIDVSDGLLADLGHILDRSEVGAELELALLPLSDAYRSRFPGTTASDLSMALSGGEDYELLFTIDSGRWAELEALSAAFDTPVTRIGTITAERQCRVLAPGGNEVQVGRQGYNHFSA